MRFKLFVSSAVLALFVFAGAGFCETIIEITDPVSGVIDAVGFTLAKGAELNIDIVGIQFPSGKSWSAYGWIINSNSRQPVWTMDRTGERVGGSKLIRQQKDVKFLEAGSYELYFIARLPDYWSGEEGSIFNILGQVFDNDDEVKRRDLRKCYVKLTSDELVSGDYKLFTPDGGFANALIKHNQMGDEEYHATAFELTQPMSIRIYALVEFPEDYHAPVDNTWIINNETRERVWEINERDLDHAGGGDKNMVYDGEVRLDRGSYTLYCMTDDSHSFEDFNVNPPYDPINWGVTVLPGSGATVSSFRVTTLDEEKEALIDLTQMRDDDFAERTFVLDQETKLHVYALGEMSYNDREFADFGGITNLASGEPVWEMTDRNTHHAGGADKNRMFDSFITLPAGMYSAFYVTDGSHSYRNWNSAAPFDKKRYGLSIYQVGDKKPASFRLANEADITKSTGILARIAQVRDNERRRARFHIDNEANVRVRAIGEGRDGNMYDYAYIVDLQSGRDVWEMTYRRTDHAGGSDKNRIIDDEIQLQPGEYEVVFITDGSHSFGSWNDSPPRYPMDWGVTVSMVK
jgi:hypothetical protein